MVPSQRVTLGDDASLDAALRRADRGRELRAHGRAVEALRELEGARDDLRLLGAATDGARVEVEVAGVQLAAGLVAEALSTAREAATTCLSWGLFRESAMARLILASAHLAAGNLRDADDEARESYDLFDRVGDRELHARALLVRADIATSILPGSARILLGEAVGVLRAGGWLLPLAWALLRQGDLAEHDAERTAFLDEAAALSADLDEPALARGLEARRAQDLARRGDVDDAVALLRATLDRTDRSGSASADPSEPPGLTADSVSADDVLVDLLVARAGLRDAAEAFDSSDRAKARGLAALVSGSRDQRRMAPVATGDGLPTSEEPVNRTVLGYHVLADDVVVFVKGQDEVSATRLPGARQKVQSALGQLVSQWTRYGIGNQLVERQLVATTQGILHELYTLLVEPVRPALDELDNGTVTVVPHGLLHQVPFPALYDGRDHLLSHWAFTLAPALAGGLRPSPTPLRDDGVLVVAAPHRRVPLWEQEGEAVRRSMPSARLAVGDAATAATFRAAAARTPYLHLGCYGRFNHDNPLLSSWQLADGWMTGADVLALDLHGTVVTATACESSRPGRDTAEPVGLALPFLAAGAKGVIVSQWLGDEVATVELVSGLYRRLARRVPPHEALRQAQLEVAGRYPHPFHWARLAYVTGAALA